MAQTLLQTLDLTKRYGEFHALKDVSLTLPEGDIYGLIGRNGAGKTTLFKCIMGLAKPSAGRIELFGGRSNLIAARRRIGFVINPAFFPYLNAADNLRYHCRVKGIQDKGEVERLLELVGLAGVKKPFKAFSLGMKNRLGIAGALLGSPSLVMLDEPVNGLDPQGIIDMRAVIKDIHARTGTTFLISSHILSELDLVATRFGFIEQGTLLQEISHRDLHEHTKKTLLIEVDDLARARTALQPLGIGEEAFAAQQESMGRYRLTLDSHLDRTSEIAHVLVTNGVQLFDLHQQEATLEEYFVRLVGRQPAQPDLSESTDVQPAQPDLGASANVQPALSGFGAPADVRPAHPGSSEGSGEQDV